MNPDYIEKNELALDYHALACLVKLRFLTQCQNNLFVPELGLTVSDSPKLKQIYPSAGSEPRWAPQNELRPLLAGDRASLRDQDTCWTGLGITQKSALRTSIEKD
jgi:hypothetical protein